MQNVGQFGQGTASTHHHPSTHQFVPSEPSPNGGSTTSTLRQFRKRDAEKNVHLLDELPSSQSKLMSESHVARVAPQNHYPPTNDPFRFASSNHSPHQPHQFQQNFISNSQQQTKYSDLTDSNHSNSITTSVIQKPKNKEYMEMCNISLSPQQHLNNNNNNQHYSSENGQYLHKDPNQNYAAMFKPSESQFFQKEQHHHQYQQQHHHHHQMVHHSIRPKFPTTIMNQNHLRKYNSSEPSDNPFLNKLSKIHPSMARSIISDHHLQQDGQSNYGASIDQRMIYGQQNHRYFAGPGPLHSPSPYTTNYNYPMNASHPYPPNYSNPSCAYPRSPQIAPPLNSRYNSIERSLSPARRGAYPPENMNLSPHMNYHPNVHQKMPSGNFSSQFRPGPEYAQHYQHRRMPQECFVQSAASGQYIQTGNHQIHNPEMNAIAENTISPSDSLKKFIENWADEETAVEINQIDGGVNLRDKLKDDAPPGTVYMINATDVQYFENNGIPIVTSENGGLQVTSENYQYLLKNGLVDNGGMVRIIEANKEISIDANGNQERVVNLQIMETPVKSDCMLANKLSCKEEEEEEEENRRAVIHQNVVLTQGISQQIADEIPLHTDNNLNNNTTKELVDKNCSPINLDHLDDNLDLAPENLKHTSTSEGNFNELADELSQDSDGDKSPNSKSMPIIDFFDLNASRNIEELESTNTELETEKQELTLSENCSNSTEQDLQSTLKELSNNDECVDEPLSLEVATISSEKRKRIFSVDDIMHNIGNSVKGHLLDLVVCDGKMILDFLENEIAFSSLELLATYGSKSAGFNKMINKTDIGVNTEADLFKVEEENIFPNILKVHGSSALVEVSGELIEITLNINNDGKKVISVKSLSDPSAVVDFNQNCENSKSIENDTVDSINLEKDIPENLQINDHNNGTEIIMEESSKPVLSEMEIPKSPSIVEDPHKTEEINDEIKMEFKAEDHGDTEEKLNDFFPISCEIQTEESIDDSIISEIDINNDCSTEILSAIDEDLISETGYHQQCDVLCSVSEEKTENSHTTDDFIQNNVETLSSTIINDSANEKDQISANIEAEEEEESHVAEETQVVTENQIKKVDDIRIEYQNNNSSHVVEEEINLESEENELIENVPTETLIDLDHVVENIILQDEHINEEFILEDQVFIEDPLVHEVIVSDPFDVSEENSSPEIPLELVTTTEILDSTTSKRPSEIEILSPTSTNIEDLSTVINCTIEKNFIETTNSDISDCTPVVATKAAKKQYESDHKVQHDLVSSSKKEDNIIIPSSNKNRKTNIKKVRRDKLMSISNNNNNKAHKEKDAIIIKKQKNNETDEEFVDFKELLRARKLKKLKKLEAEETEIKNEKKSIKHAVEQKIKAKKISNLKNRKNKEKVIKNAKNEKICKEEVDNIPEEKKAVVEKVVEKTAIKLISNNSEEHPSSTSNINNNINKPLTEKENSLLNIEELYPKDPRRKSKNSEAAAPPPTASTILAEIVAENPGKKKISLADYVSRKRKATTSNSENEIDQKKLKEEEPSESNNINNNNNNNNKIDVVTKITPVSIIHSCDWEDSNSPTPSAPILNNEEVAEECLIIEDICGLNKINYNKKPVIDLNELLPVNNNNVNNNIEDKTAVVDKALQEYKEKVDLKLNTLNIQIPILKPRRRSFEMEKKSPDIVKKFMNNELLSESEFKQIQTIISYKKRSMEIQKNKKPIIINNNNNLTICETNNSHSETTNEVRMHLKKVNAKRKSFLDSDNNDDDNDDDDEDCSSVKSYQSCKNVNYSVINRLGEDGLPKIIFKRNAKVNNINMNKEPVVELVKLNLKELEKVKKNIISQ